MPRPTIDLGQRVKDMLKHVGPLPPEASAPLAHYKKSANGIWTLLAYLQGKVTDQAHKPKVFDRHKLLLHSMVLVNFGSSAGSELEA